MTLTDLTTGQLDLDQDDFLTDEDLAAPMGKPVPGPKRPKPKPSKRPRQPILQPASQAAIKADLRKLAEQRESAIQQAQPGLDPGSESGYDIRVSQPARTDIRMEVNPSFDFTKSPFQFTSTGQPARLDVSQVRRRIGETQEEFLQRSGQFEKAKADLESRRKESRRLGRAENLAPSSTVGRLGKAFAQGVAEPFRQAARGVHLIGGGEAPEWISDPGMPLLNQAESEQFSTKLVGGAGSLVPALLYATATGGLGTSIFFGSGGLGSTYEEARSKGFDHQNALAAGVVGAAIGSLEGMLGAGSSHQARGFLRNALEESGEEAFTQLLNNANAKIGSGYDPQRAISEGVLESGLIGGILGGALPGGLKIADLASKVQADLGRPLSPAILDAARAFIKDEGGSASAINTAEGLNNLLSYLKESKVKTPEGDPIPVYHGTQSPREIEQVDFSKLDPDALYGSGFYMTQDPEVAAGEGGYALTKADRGGSEGTPHSYKLYADIKNPFDIDSPVDPEIAKLFADTSDEYEDYPIQSGTLLPDFDNNKELYLYLGQRFDKDKASITDWLKKAGYDGITHIGGGRVIADIDNKTFSTKQEADIVANRVGGTVRPSLISASGQDMRPRLEGDRVYDSYFNDITDSPDLSWTVDGHRVWIAFDPKQVKSATGNRGTFDPSDPRISYKQSEGPVEPLVLKATFKPADDLKASVIVAPAQHAVDLGLVSGNQSIGGVSIDLSLTEKQLQGARSYLPSDLVQAMTSAIEDARAKGQSKVNFIFQGQGDTPERISRNIQHETFHSGQAQGVSATTMFDPEFFTEDLYAFHSPELRYDQRITDLLSSPMGQLVVAGRLDDDLRRDSLVVELAAYVASGDGARFGMNEQAQAEFLVDYFESAISHRGVEAVEALARTAQLRPQTENILSKILGRPISDPVPLSVIREVKGGPPLLVYRGLATGNSPSPEAGIYFTPDRDYAATYAENEDSEGEEGIIQEAYLDVRNPYRMLNKPNIVNDEGITVVFTPEYIQNLKDSGYDGIIVGSDPNDPDAADLGWALEIVVFEPSQIKENTYGRKYEEAQRWFEANRPVQGIRAALAAGSGATSQYFSINETTGPDQGTSDPGNVQTIEPEILDLGTGALADPGSLAPPPLSLPPAPFDPGFDPIITQVLLNDPAMAELTRAFIQVVQDLGLEYDPRIPPFIQLADAIARGDVPSPLIDAVYARYGLTPEQFARGFRASSSAFGRGLQHLSQIQRRLGQVALNPSLARHLPPEQIASTLLSQLHASSLGRSLWDQGGTLLRKMALDRLSTTAVNVITTVGRLPLSVADGMSGFAWGVLHPDQFRNSPTDSLLAAGRRSALNSMRSSAEVVRAMNPRQLVQLLRRQRRSESAYYDSVTTQIEQFYPDLHRQLHGLSSQIDEAGTAPSVVEAARQAVDRITDPVVRADYDRQVSQLENRLRFDRTIAGRLVKGVDLAYTIPTLPSQWQEFFFRRPFFVGYLHADLARRGINLDQVIRDGTWAEIPEESLRASLDHALEFTFAYAPHEDSSSSVERSAHHIIKGLNALGPIGFFIEAFPKAIYNGMKFWYEYGPLGALHPANNIRKAISQGGVESVSYQDMERMSRAALGTMMYVAAAALRSAFGGEEWWQIKTGKKDKNGKPIYRDIRRFQPFSSYVYIADLHSRVKEGRLIDKQPSKDIQEIYLGTRKAGDQSSGALFDTLNATFAWWGEDYGAYDKASALSKRQVGQALALPTIPLSNLRDLVAQFNADENIKRDTRDAWMGPAIDNIPWLRRSMPASQSPTEPAPQEISTESYKRVPFTLPTGPAAGQFMGLRTVSGGNFITREISRLGLNPFQWLHRDPDPTIDRAQYAEFSRMLEARSERLAESDRYRLANNADKAAILEEMILDNDLPQAAKEKGLQANPSEALRREKLKEAGEGMHRLRKRASGIDKRFRKP